MKGLWQLLESPATDVKGLRKRNNIVDEEGLERLTRIVREATPVLRESLLMPDVEYEAELSIPVVPEPFAFVQLRRHAKHADPVASMGCVTAMALLMLAVIAFVVIVPPWVPGV